MRQFVCSVVVGKDLVPRLGIITLDSLKRQMLKELSSCHLPKVAAWLYLSNFCPEYLCTLIFLTFCCLWFFVCILHCV